MPTGMLNPLYDPEYEKVARQLAEAQALRGEGYKGASGGGYQGGKIYIRANPWGNVAQGLAGVYMGNRAENQMTDIGAKRNAERQQFADAFDNAKTLDEQRAITIAARNKGYDTGLERAFINTKEMGVLANTAAQLRAQQATETANRTDSRAAKQQGWQSNENALNRAMQLQKAKTKGSATGPKALTSAETKSLSELGQYKDTLDILNSDFKNKYSYSDYGPFGDYARAGESKLGAWASKDAQARNEWWSKYEMMLEIPKRHEFFGSALTPGEAASWNKARQIKPGMSAARIKSALSDMQRIYTDVMARKSEALKAGGKSGESVDALTGDRQSTVTDPEGTIRRLAKEQGLDPDLAVSMWQQESGGSTDTALKGPPLPNHPDTAVGPFQIVPSMHPQFPVNGGFEDQARYALNYLKQVGPEGYYGTGTPPPGQPSPEEYVAQVNKRAQQMKAQSPSVPALPQAEQAMASPAKINSKVEMDALPPGTKFIAPDGSVRTKP